jgi:mRNA interferase MazF
MRRGDLVTIATLGDYGKPRPALIVQSDAFEPIPSVTLLPLTSEIHDEHLIRITVQPTKGNGLAVVSQVMIDKATTVPRTKVGAVIGEAGLDTMRAVNLALGRFLDVLGDGAKR